MSWVLFLVFNLGFEFGLLANHLQILKSVNLLISIFLRSYNYRICLVLQFYTICLVTIFNDQKNDHEYKMNKNISLTNGFRLREVLFQLVKEIIHFILISVY